MKNVPSNLHNLKSKVDKLDVHKLVHVPFHWSKLSDVVKNYIVKKDVYNAKIKNIDDKKTDCPKLATNTTFNAKIKEVKGKIPSITNLAAAAAPTTVENKIPNVSDIVKTTRFWCKNIRNGKQKFLLILIIISSRVTDLMQR